MVYSTLILATNMGIVYQCTSYNTKETYITAILEQGIKTKLNIIILQ